MVGGKFNCEVSGLVLSKKVREDLVSIWTPSGLPVPALEGLRDRISELLETHLGLKPEISFMSHDKKNKVYIEGVGEKKQGGERKGGPKADKENNGYPTSPTSGPAQTRNINGVKPRKPSHALVSEAQKRRTEVERPRSPTNGPVEPTTNPWEARAAAARATEKPKVSAPTNVKAPAPVLEMKAPVVEEPQGDPEWEVVRTKNNRGRKGSRKKTL